jgi:uncharacterized membrane protein
MASSICSPASKLPPEKTAANFNLVPAAVLEMRDQHGIIEYQAPFAAAMFLVHVVLLWSLIWAGQRGFSY